MPHELKVDQVPLVGHGERTGSTPGLLDPYEAFRLEGGVVVGRGIVAQTPDWNVSATATDAIGTPPVGGTQCDAICGGPFPFAQIGNIGAGATSGAVAFSFKTSTDKVFVHHLNEVGGIIRTLDFGNPWTATTPPRITGFEMSGRFFFNLDGGVDVRPGLSYYDPQAGTITRANFNLEAQGAQNLQFRGISLHQGGTIFGWGYNHANNTNAAHLVRYCKYTDPDTWIAAAADGDITAGKFPVGTVGVPVIGIAQSGRYSIIGKEREIFAVEGNYSAQFAITPIGNAHGPVSTTGICSIGDAAVWMAEDGPTWSQNGGKVQQLGIDRLLRRQLMYFDFASCAAVHYSTANRVGFLLHRKTNFDLVPLTRNQPDEILWWDYQRDEFFTERTPATCYSIGTIKGAGLVLPGPAGAPSAIASNTVTNSSANATWTNGESGPATTTTLEYKKNSNSTWITASNSIGAGVATYTLTGLAASTAYDVRLTHQRNGQSSTTTTSSNLFTTAATSTVGTPTSFTVADGGYRNTAGKFYVKADFDWIQKEFSAGAKTELWQHTANNFSLAAKVLTVGASTISATIERLQDTGTTYWFWLRHTLADGTAGANAGPVSYIFAIA